MMETARLVPVWRELLCGGVTTVEVHARLRTFQRDGGGPLADVTSTLESVGAGGERRARYSVVGIGHRARITESVLSEHGHALKGPR